MIILKKIAKPILELSGVCRSDKKSAVERLDLSVPSGDSFAVLYKNNDNISLLLEILSGRVPPKKGKVFFKGDDITGVKNVFGVVVKDPTTPKRKTVADAAAAPVVKRGLSKELAGVLTAKELKAIGLEKLGAKQFSELSPIEAAKAHIFMAYMCSHEFITIDEPFSTLSESEREDALVWLEGLCRGSKLSLLVFTKDLDLAVRLGDYVMVADNNTASKGIIAIEKGKEKLAAKRLSDIYDSV